ncbi:SAF domain-containing protein [Streptomyces sp. NPDC056938]|uniref:SAF domain-containing protein n=1 Tax=Streptomyces sp. NPDC056938 TaxID=3345970 RepID=UPI00363E5CB6
MTNRGGAAVPPAAPHVVRPELDITDPTPPRGRRRSTLVVGAVMVLAGAIGFAGLMNASSDRRDVLALARDVPLGQKLTRDDLRVVSLPAESGLKTVPAGDKDQIIGKRSAAALAAGTTLTRGQLGGKDALAAGEELVAVEVKRGMAPVDALRPGDEVRLVTLPREGEATTGADGKKTASAEADGRVLKVGGPSPSGDVVVQVAVAQADSSQVAADAAASRIALVVKAKG